MVRTTPTVPTGAVSLVVMPGIVECQGEVDFDDLNVVPNPRDVDDEGTFTNSIGMKFMKIRPGEFLMGTAGSDGPQHRVKLTKGFLIGVTEVTQAQWKAVMGSNSSCFRGE